MSKMCHSRGRRSQAAARRGRRGTAVAELAVSLPPLVLLVFASVECSSMVFLKQSVTLCAYEGARVAAHPEGTESAAQSRIQQIAAGRNVQGATTTFSENVDKLPRGAAFVVTVTAPSGLNSYLPPWFFGGKTLAGAVTMVKE